MSPPSTAGTPTRKAELSGVVKAESNDSGSPVAKHASNGIDKSQQYKQLKDKLKKALQIRKQLEKNLCDIEEAIFDKETQYLSTDSTAQTLGNIVKGFDNFAKHHSNNKKLTFTNEDRIFSLSCASYNKMLQKDEP